MAQLHRVRDADIEVARFNITPGQAFTHLSLCLLTEEVREDRPTRTRESFAPQLDTPPGATSISMRIYNQRVIDA